MRKLKHDERLVGKMCKQVQDFAEDIAKGLAEDMAKGLAEDLARDIAETKRLEERQDAICNMIELGLTKEQILKKYSEEEYRQAEESILANIS